MDELLQNPLYRKAHSKVFHWVDNGIELDATTTRTLEKLTKELVKKHEIHEVQRLLAVEIKKYVDNNYSDMVEMLYDLECGEMEEEFDATMLCMAEEFLLDYM